MYVYSINNIYYYRLDEALSKNKFDLPEDMVNEVKNVNGEIWMTNI